METPAASLPAAKPLRARLRDETRAAHETLDGSFAMLSAGDRNGYALFLEVNAACLAKIEPLLAASPLAEAMPDLDWTTHRSEAAATDLAAIGRPGVSALPFPIREPTLAEAIGIAYVIEGSRLGARMILKGLRKGAGGEPPERFTTHFLESAGGPDRFRDFLGLAEALVVTSSHRDMAVAAADATFEYFIDAVDRILAVNQDGGAN